ncbi:CIC11C00000001633 [Sungouiella intermedia]|uniref:L-serine ammonia-lyase n=1 Tax=Sungouiella intermedia TaxID=45354 RepID=A0A1L0DR78_9ASCO|nr:CIC11C00000001633 [[Candida] intermedia]
MVAPSTNTSLVDVSSKYSGPCRFLFKNELEQPSGSFKLRGMSKLVGSAVEKAKLESSSSVHVYTSSGGNAGIAAAYASKHHNVPCTVVLPVTSKQAALDALTLLGATVVIHGAHWGEADTYLKEVVMKKDQKIQPDTLAIYCHPFDNEILWEGHADIVDDLASQLKEINVSPSNVKGLVCSCGGGGLYNGIVTGLRRNNLSEVPVLVLETNQTPAFYQSVAAGKPIVLPKVETLSTTLGAPYICEKTWEIFQSHPTFVEIMDDLDAVQGTIDYYEDFGALVEPACGITVAAANKKQELLSVFGELKPDDVIVFIICGGSGILSELLETYRGLVAK